MFAACLASLSKLVIPDGTEITFIFVENGEDLTITSTVEAFAQKVSTPHQVHYLLEPSLGIPIARNRALDFAHSKACDWLLFLDDDEIADPNWLVEHMNQMDARAFDLAAGPVEVTPPKGALSHSEQTVFDYLNLERRKRYKIRTERAKAGRSQSLDVATGNWIARLDALHRHNLRFDERMRFTGGSDTDLSRRARDAGLKIGWVPEAIVRENIPKSRLTKSYIFDRSRNQTLAKHFLQVTKSGRRSVAKHLATALTKSIVGTVRVLVGRLSGNSILELKGLKSLGVAAGEWQGIRGRQSHLYSSTHGE